MIGVYTIQFIDLPTCSVLEVIKFAFKTTVAFRGAFQENLSPQLTIVKLMDCIMINLKITIIYFASFVLIGKP